MDTVELRLDEVRTDGGTQVRAWLEDDALQDYQREMEGGKQFPPLEVVYDGTHYWLWDGFHRHEAATMAGRETFDCHVIPGTQSDAQWLSYGANKANSVRRSNRDKRRAVHSALRARPEMSDRAIAEHVGVDHKTVGAVRAEIASERVTGEIPQSGTRVDRNGRQLDVTGINAGRAPAEASTAPVHEDTVWPNHEMRTSAPVPGPVKAIEFQAKEPPEGGWPVLREDGTFDDDRAECLVDAVAQRWCDIKILELEPETLFRREVWIAAFSIGCKPCVHTEPLTDASEDYDAFPTTREAALAAAALRLAMYCWRHEQDASVPKTAKEVLERFRLWALATGNIDRVDFEREVQGEENRRLQKIIDRVEQYGNAVCDLSLTFDHEPLPEDDYHKIARMFVDDAADSDGTTQADALPHLDDAITRLTAFVAAVREIQAKMANATEAADVAE